MKARLQVYVSTFLTEDILCKIWNKCKFCYKSRNRNVVKHLLIGMDNNKYRMNYQHMSVKKHLDDEIDFIIIGILNV